MNPPPPPARSGLVLAWATRISDYLRSLRFTSGPGIQIQHTTTGVTISSTSTPTPAPTFPLQLSVVTLGGRKKINVALGTVAGGTPEDVGFEKDNNEWVLLLDAKAGHVYARVKIDAETGDVTARSIIIESTSRESDPEEGIYYEFLGSIHASAGSYTVTNARYGPVNLLLCRDWYRIMADVEYVPWLATFF